MEGLWWRNLPRCITDVSFQVRALSNCALWRAWYDPLLCVESISSRNISSTTISPRLSYSVLDHNPTNLALEFGAAIGWHAALSFCGATWPTTTIFVSVEVWFVLGIGFFFWGRISVYNGSPYRVLLQWCQFEHRLKRLLTAPLKTHINFYEIYHLRYFSGQWTSRHSTPL